MTLSEHRKNTATEKLFLSLVFVENKECNEVKCVKLANQKYPCW